MAMTASFLMEPASLASAAGQELRQALDRVHDQRHGEDEQDHPRSMRQPVGRFEQADLPEEAA
jgi:hypothetical protein